MIALLDPRMWGAAVLAFWIGYGYGWYRTDRQCALERAAEIGEAVAKARADEQAIAKEQERIIREALKHAEQTAADATNAKTAAEGATAAARAAVARARRMCAPATTPSAGTAPATEPPGAPAGDAIGMLGVVFSQCGERLAEMAGYADRARLAGQTCAAEYDAARARLMLP